MLTFHNLNVFKNIYSKEPPKISIIFKKKINKILNLIKGDKIKNDKIFQESSSTEQIKFNLFCDVDM
jgi:hypothetical protein